MTKQELLKALWTAEKENPTTKITGPEDIYLPLLKYRNKKREYFIVITLDGAHQIIKQRVVSIGMVNRTLTHPREVFRNAISDNAVAIIVAHNHPSGNSEPSRDDDLLTERLTAAGKIIGIEVLDHVIITRTGNYSYLENGKL